MTTECNRETSGKIHGEVLPRRLQRRIEVGPRGRIPPGTNLLRGLLRLGVTAERGETLLEVVGGRLRLEHAAYWNVDDARHHFYGGLPVNVMPMSKSKLLWSNTKSTVLDVPPSEWSNVPATGRVFPTRIDRNV
jgi:hypothetical protein